jgi:hypothetical protein
MKICVGEHTRVRCMANAKATPFKPEQERFVSLRHAIAAPLQVGV